MGCFDSVFVECPECKEEVELQTKVGRCMLDRHTIAQAPPLLLLDLANKNEVCSKGHGFYLRVQCITHTDVIKGKYKEAYDEQ